MRKKERERESAKKQRAIFIAEFRTGRTSEKRKKTDRKQFIPRDSIVHSSGV